ncbi:hypothetical protein [Ferruginibacter sp. HRS2-29]|uniref:hypothetical protein n=1 Tax=Ferruginibacter sp. HRS2-29 TaxID=2487334 RepID=UPI0020CEB079|nr:hypothetical protein [Ferruginibacter sp. HRS2-29]MCP9753398.1 hypothetical protein [Ferruginibacter sp. HRS2-29]
MKMLLLLVSLFYLNDASAQSSINIDYVSIATVPSDSVITEVFKDRFPPYIRMVINDSFSLSFFLSHIEKKVYRKAIIGDKLIHHAEFSNYITGETFSESDWPKNKRYLIRYDSSRINKWEMMAGEKMILNYRCKAVTSVNKNNTTTIVWYTTEMKFKRGDLFYPGVPGVVLEVYDYGWNGTGQYIRAISAKESGQVLVAPKHTKIVTFEEIGIRNKK